MTSAVGGFGREIPLGLQLWPGTPEGGLVLVVTYRDGLEIVSGDSQALKTTASANLAVETSKVYQGLDDLTILVGGTSLSVLDAGLQPCSVTAPPDDEPVRGLVPLHEGRFLTYSDDETVRCWTTLDGPHPVCVSAWAVSCLPLFARGNGKSVLCVENGRLCERDPFNGTLLKTWPKAPSPIVSAFGDAAGHSVVTIDEEGHGLLWDLHSRELVFAFNVPLPLNHGAFRANGSEGVLLSQEGELLTFKVAAGGTVKPCAALGHPAVDAVCAPSGEIVALDENGGLWLVQETPRHLGGSWAGWATGGLALADGRTVVGTASGELLLYPDGPGSVLLCAPHKDAVIGLFEWEKNLLSVSADGLVATTALDDFARPQVLCDLGGHAVVGCLLEPGGDRLWLALEEGRVVWLDPGSGRELGEYQFPEHRIEEIRPGGKPGELLVLTDRGSLKRLRI